MRHPLYKRYLPHSNCLCWSGNTATNAGESIKNKKNLFVVRLGKADEARQTYTSSRFIDKVEVLGHFPKPLVKDAGLHMLFITVTLL